MTGVPVNGCTVADLPAGARQASPRGSGGSGGLFAESSRVEAFSDGIFAVAITLLVAGVALYAVSGLCAIWYPVAGLAVLCALPVFYGVTSAGLRSPGPREP
jgi:hypothetical protein